MRKTLIAAAAATILSAGAFLTSGANAMTLTAPAGMRLAAEDANPVEQIRHRCYRVRGGLVCPRHRRVIVAPGYGYGFYGPTVGIGIGYGGWWGGYGYGWGGHRWGGHRTVIHRHVHRGGRHGRGGRGGRR